MGVDRMRHGDLAEDHRTTARDLGRYGIAELKPVFDDNAISVAIGAGKEDFAHFYRGPLKV
jgi:hypothetical protein